jgi:GH24 family phage-related lysozyme (muramidase)
VNRQAIIDQLKQDEGFSPLAFWDKKQWTYGYGCRAPGECARISEADASPVLEKHVDAAIADFDRIFKGHEQKFNDVRAAAFVNLIFNMGAGRPGGNEGLLSFKNTLNFIFKNKEVPWDKVAGGLKASLWFRQVGTSGNPPGRGNRIVAEVLTGLKA